MQYVCLHVNVCVCFLEDWMHVYVALSAEIYLLLFISNARVFITWPHVHKEIKNEDQDLD